MALKQVTGANSTFFDGVSWDTSAFTNGTMTVRFRPNSNILVRYIRTIIIQINDPTWTNITAKIHIDKGGIKGDELFASTTTHTKSSIFTLKEGFAEIPFQFNDVALNKDTWYHFALLGAGASFTSSNFLAWKTSYPDPVYKTGLGISFGNRPNFPYEFMLIGADF